MLKRPRILIFDVETTPVLAWIWRPGPRVFISHEQIKRGQRFEIICIAYKWLGARTTHSLTFNLSTGDSSSMLRSFSAIVDKADLVVGHNSDSFDIKQINTQRLLHGQPPINWPTTEDTLKQFRKYFAFPSYKLDYLAKILNGTGKDRMVFQDWIDIVENKSLPALRKMVKYCKNDVRQLEGVFQKALQFFKPKINASLIVNDNQSGCPRCGSLRLHGAGLVTLAAGRYRRFSCQACGHKFRLTRAT